VHQATEHILEPRAERQYGLLINRRASPERRGNFDGRAALAALCQRDGVRAALISQRLPRRALGGVERGGRRLRRACCRSCASAMRVRATSFTSESASW